MKTCPKCGFANLDTAKFCEKDGYPLSAPTPKWLFPAIIAAVVALIIGGMIVFLPEEKPLPPKVDYCADFQSPTLDADVRTEYAVALDGNRHGGVFIYKIQRDNERDYKFLKRYELNYKNETPDNTIDIFIANNAESGGNKVVYLYKPDLLVVRESERAEMKQFVNLKLIKQNRQDALKEWQSDVSDYYLFCALVPADLRQKSCVVKVEHDKTTLLYLNGIGKGLFAPLVVSGIGYTPNKQIVADDFTKEINKIPTAQREYVFTFGDNIVGMSAEVEKTFANSEFIPISKLTGTVTGDSEIGRTLEIYQTILRSIGSGCFIYRKNVFPEVGYLLYNND
jgi:hypothetical protein